MSLVPIGYQSYPIHPESGTDFLNDNKQNTVYFYPPKIPCEKKLLSIDYFHAPVFISEGLCFKGEADLKRFLDAVNDTLEEFDFLFFHLHEREGELYAGYSGDKDCIQLETEEKKEPLNTATLPSILPQKVDKKILDVVTDQLDGLPTIAFKLTIFTDGFSIGCYWNHACLDQSSITYFFKYLSQMYSYGKGDFSLKKPILVDKDLIGLIAKTSQAYENIADFRERSAALTGFKYSPPKADKIHESELAPQLSSRIVELNFNISEINQLKTRVKEYLSVNDVIHAIVLKIYSLSLELLPDECFCFGFACNMRKYCGLGEEAIGNFLSHPLMPLKVNDIRNKTILELALANRQRVSEITSGFFKESLDWYKYLQEHHENPLNYSSTFDLLNARVTNWTTFDYDNILFDGSSPIALKTPSLASL